MSSYSQNHFESHWQPSASIEMLRQRSAILTSIRQFFTAKNYLEVETPIMSRFGVSDVYLCNIKAEFREKPYYLHTSPEYFMKRLLAAGSGSIFQLARVFRDDELGRWHNPEFTLLECYRLDFNHHQLMDEMDELLQRILQTNSMLRKTYQQVFLESCAIDPFKANIQELNSCLSRYNLANVLPTDETDIDQYLFLLMSFVVEPYLAKQSAPVAVYDFPISQASLAKTKNGVAERFEVYYQGVELANGFHELTDASEQRQRFDEDNRCRQVRGISTSPLDEYLLNALQHGLPACSGVAMGIDRLVAIALNQSSITNTLSFDFSRV